LEGVEMGAERLRESSSKRKEKKEKKKRQVNEIKSDKYIQVKQIRGQYISFPNSMHPVPASPPATQKTKATCPKTHTHTTLSSHYYNKVTNHTHTIAQNECWKATKTGEQPTKWWRRKEMKEGMNRTRNRATPRNRSCKWFQPESEM
jgi:hypothetical protein